MKAGTTQDNDYRRPAFPQQCLKNGSKGRANTTDKDKRDGRTPDKDEGRKVVNLKTAVWVPDVNGTAKLKQRLSSFWWQLNQNRKKPLDSMQLSVIGRRVSSPAAAHDRGR